MKFSRLLIVLLIIVSVFPEAYASYSIEPVFEEIDDGEVDWVSDHVYDGRFGLKLFNPYGVSGRSKAIVKVPFNESFSSLNSFSFYVKHTSGVPRFLIFLDKDGDDFTDSVLVSDYLEVGRGKWIKGTGGLRWGWCETGITTDYSYGDPWNGLDYWRDLYGNSTVQYLGIIHYVNDQKNVPDPIYIDGVVINGEFHDFEPEIIVSRTYVSDNRCDVGSEQTVGYRIVLEPDSQPAVGCRLLVKDQLGYFEKISSGKIFYDTFSSNSGTETDGEWHQGFTWYGGSVFDDGYWEVEEGKYKAVYDSESAFAYPEVWVTDFVWEAKVKPLSLISEGPEIRFIAYSGNELVLGGVYDYYHSGKNLRLMINSDGLPHTTYETKPFTMNENAWYTLKFKVEGARVVCYINGNTVFDVIDDSLTDLPSRRLLHCGYDDEETGYLDDVRVWVPDVVVVYGLSSGQKVDLVDEHGWVVAYGNAEDGAAYIDVEGLSFPFSGSFNVYDGAVFLGSSSLLTDIWGGDEYIVHQDHVLFTDDSGWANFTVSQYSVMSKEWEIGELEYAGETDYELADDAPTIIWDRVDFALSCDDVRVDVGEPVEILVEGRYAYDDQPFQGSYTLNDTAVKVEASKVSYAVAEIVDSLYSLSVFSSNSVDCLVAEMCGLSLDSNFYTAAYFSLTHPQRAKLQTSK